MENKEIVSLSLTELKERIIDGSVSSKQAVEACLERINDNKDLNAVTNINKCALDDALIIDKKIANGEKVGDLAGIPVILKANMCTNDSIPTTCCSKFLRDFRAPYEATVVKRLKEQDAIIIGKSNMDEFAMGSSNENSAFGKVLNPIDKTRVPGGSSGGSAAAVAGNLCFSALGSDTGGSIREPASLCGVVGIKPTYGTVSRRGLVAFASSLDQIGPLTRSVRDNALVLDVISGADEKDSTCNRKIVKRFSSSFKKSIAGMKIGIAKEYLDLPMEPDVRTAVNSAIEFYKTNGAEIVNITLPNVDKALAVYYVLSSAEAASNLSRFDGIRYGERVEGDGIVDTYYRSRTNGFGTEVKRRIMLGNYVLSSGFYDAYYKKATKVQQVLKQEFKKAFEKCDAILSPVSPSVAWHFGDKSTPLANYMSDIFTVPVNIVGCPAISFPCGKGEGNMPIGLQLIGAWNNEYDIYALAEFFERFGGRNK